MHHIKHKDNDMQLHDDGHPVWLHPACEAVETALAGYHNENSLPMNVLST